MKIDDDDANVGEVVLDKSKINYIFYTLLCTGDFRNVLSRCVPHDESLQRYDMWSHNFFGTYPRRDNICLIEFISSMHSLILYPQLHCSLECLALVLLSSS